MEISDHARLVLFDSSRDRDDLSDLEAVLSEFDDQKNLDEITDEVRSNYT
jgi:hypothetical protein